ncbi:MAG: helix-turn-helix domain-containing protein [Phycisphaerales bacterium]|nr:helix-turn-helix domain-containing protein [Phycisphaerales bacterium]
MHPEQPLSGEHAIKRASSGSARDFNPEMLTTAREAKRLTQTDLAQLLGVSQPLVGKWEAGLGTPTDENVAKLGEVLGVMPAFFFYDRPRRLASMSDFYHRAMTRVRRKEVKSVHAMCSMVDMQIDRLLKGSDVPDNAIPEIDPDNHAGDIEKIARMTRVAMGVGSGPIKDVVSLIERCGGIVIDRDFDADIDALCRWIPGLPRLFFVNGQRPTDRLRFSLCHELAHTVMHFENDFDFRLAEEQADRFAAAFLMPADDIRCDFSSRLQLSSLAGLKRKWRVSMGALIRRALTLGVIDDSRYKYLCIELSKRGWRKTEPIDLTPESPSTLRRMIADHLEMGYTRDDLCNLLLVSHAWVDDLLRNETSPTYENDGVRLRLTW